MISDLAILGATGDLTGRFLLPALARLMEAGKLPPDFTVTGAATADWQDVTFREHAVEQLRAHASDVPQQVVDDLAPRLQYRRVNVTDPTSTAAVLRSIHRQTTSGEPRPVAVYLALPIHVVPATIAALSAADLPDASRIAVEKPFGEDLESAISLNALLDELVAAHGRSVDVFRVDHVLGMETISNMVALRFANMLLRSVWNSAHIARIEVLWEESLGLEGRAGYFDGAGTLKDVLQNHMLQILSLVAMEEPNTPGDLRDCKVQVLREVRHLTPDDVVSRTRRGRYTAGRLASDRDGGGRMVSSYVDEEGVDPQRSTETFAEVGLTIDSPRWAGTEFVLRAGKALSRRRKGILVHFRHLTDNGPFTRLGPHGGRLWIGLDGPHDISLQLTGATSIQTLAPSSVTLTSPQPAAGLPPYGHVLLDVLGGGNSLSVGGDEAEQAWRVVAPVLDGWRRGQVPLEDYSAGSSGPTRGEYGGLLA